MIRLNIGFGPVERTVKINQVHHDCMELFAYFNNKLVEALVKCTKTSLDLLRTKAESLKYFNTCVFLYISFCILLYIPLFMRTWQMRRIK